MQALSLETKACRMALLDLVTLLTEPIKYKADELRGMLSGLV